MGAIANEVRVSEQEQANVTFPFDPASYHVAA